MPKNGLSWIPVLSISVMIILILSAFMTFMSFISGCKELPEVEVSPDLQKTVCIEACKLAREKGCKRLGQADLTSKACEPLCDDIVSRVPIPNLGCVIDAVTCEEMELCPI